MSTMTELIPPCKTSLRRSIRWTPGTDPADPAAGSLEVWDGPTGKPRCRHYRVVELVPGRGFAGRDCRCFALTKPDGTVYHATVERDRHSCDCRWGCSGNPPACCHVEALLALVENRWLPDPQADPRPEPEPLGDGLALDLGCPHCLKGRLREVAAGVVACDYCGACC
jgi:hypothetical protein